MNRIKLIFCDRTHGVAVRTMVAAQRVHVAGVEGQVAPAAHNGRNTRPIVAVDADSVQNTVKSAIA